MAESIEQKVAADKAAKKKSTKKRNAVQEKEFKRLEENLIIHHKQGALKPSIFIGGNKPIDLSKIFQGEDIDKKYFKTDDKETKPSDDSAPQESQKPLENARAKVKDTINNLTGILTNRPQFLKPAYFLEEKTPFVSVKIIITDAGKQRIVQLVPPPKEGEMNNNGDKGNSFNANVKSFTHRIASAEIELVLTNVDQYLMEYLTYVITSLNYEIGPILEIEYGWAYPEIDINVDVLFNMNNDMGAATKCFFRKNIFCILTDLDLNYNATDAQLIIKGKKEDSFPEPFQYFLPYDFLGSAPGVTLQMIHSLYILGLYFNELDKGTANNRTTHNVETIKQIVEFLFFFKQIKTLDSIDDVIVNAVKFFRPELATRFDYSSRYTLEAQNHVKLLQNNEKEYWTNSKNLADKTSLTKLTKSKYTTIDSMIKSLIQSVSSDKSTGMTVDNGYGKNIQDFFTKVYQVNSVSVNKYTAVTVKEGEADSSSEFYGGSLFDIQNNLRAYAKESKDLRDLVISLTPLMGESKVHPWDVLRFCLDSYKIQLENIKAKIDSEESIPTERKEEIKRTIYKEIFNFDQEKIAYRDVKSTNEFYDYKDEKGLVAAGSISVRPATSWNGLFSEIAGNCYVNVDKESYKKITEISEAEYNADESTKKESVIPMPINSHTYVSYKKEAIASLEIFKVLVECRQQSNPSSEFLKGQIEAVDNIISMVKGYSNNVPIILTYFDVIEGPDVIFNPMSIKNKILQAYSMFPNANLSNEGRQFNPGVPNVWSISYPDVKSFNPKFKVMDTVSNLNAIMKEQLPGTKEARQRELDKVTAKYENASVDLKEAKAKGGKTADELKTMEENVEELKNTKMSLQNVNEIYERYHNKLPYQRPSSLLLKHDTTEGSKYGEVLANRKQMQEFRKHLMMSSSGIEADMTVIGDPMFDINCLQYYLFLKMFNPDGTLNFFTGPWNIKDVVHEISAGTFNTNFSIVKDVTAMSSPQMAGQLFTAITEKDNIYMQGK